MALSWGAEVRERPIAAARISRLARPEMDSKLYGKYSRQILFAEIGEAGQQHLLGERAVLVGCGALGTSAANLLVRAGLGRLRIIDRDFVEASNLQRQTLFLLNDVAVKLGVPWIYAAVVSSYGVTMTVLPEETACLACLLETRAGPGLEETCDTVGVLGAAAGVIASF